MMPAIGLLNAVLHRASSRFRPGPSPLRLDGQWWELLTHLGRPGQASVRARATDQAGHTQAGRPVWNRQGYGNNAVQDVSVSATG